MMPALASSRDADHRNGKLQRIGSGQVQQVLLLHLKEILMRKFTLIAALLTTTTCAHAGNSISFEIDGHKVRIEASKNCDQLSCLKISGVDLKGFDFKRLNSSRFDGDDDAAVKSDS